jgi:hypothetical protein
MAALPLLFPFIAPSVSGAAAAGDPQRRARAPRVTRHIPPPSFSHRTPAHARECAACHVFPSANWEKAREDPFPDVVDYPRHASCLGCHRRQFFARERPAPRICSVCHVAVTPRYTERFPFPSLGAKAWDSKKLSVKGTGFFSAFRVAFPHAKHLELLSRAERARPRVVPVAFRQEEASAVCATCHALYAPKGNSPDEYASPAPKTIGEGFWLKKGTFETIPETHAACFTCHSTESEVAPLPGDCAACHELVPAGERVDFDPAAAAAKGDVDPVALRAWRRRDASATFRHEGGVHPDLDCTACHDVAKAEGAAPRVSIASCASCHVTESVDDGGWLNLEVERRRADQSFVCTKCHLAFGTAPVPASHLDALAGARSE